MTGDLTAGEVLARRAARHHLLTPAVEGPAAAARVVCGVHAQIMSAAELSLGLRVAGATRSHVRRALWEDRTLVKTFGPRGTVHLLAAEDLPLWTAALSAVPRPGESWADEVRLTPDRTEAVLAAIVDALRGEPLTAEELGEAVVERTGAWAADPVLPAFGGWWPRWRQALGTAAHRGTVVFGPDRGRRATYTHPMRAVPGFAPADQQTALRFLVRSYLHAYGPASSDHLARWLAAPPAWAADLITTMGDELEAVTIQGAGPLWQLADERPAQVGRPPAEPPPAEALPGVRLLPYFDAYVVGSHPRDLIFPGRAADRALNRGQAGNYPVLLVDGVVAGVWHLRRSGTRLAVTVEPLRALGEARRRELEEQVERVGHILEGTATLTVGRLSVGPHA
ncbi:winged helix DNA-binding domain-containing protein [Georgenia daeguensis]|uniref:Winged helix DNA-binding domain-containing protein n=1 Tax=Georgenia daeguensis TaxID=908355 RepID=A0ABP8ERD6_9MICO